MVTASVATSTAAFITSEASPEGTRPRLDGRSDRTVHTERVATSSEAHITRRANPKGTRPCLDWQRH